MKKFLAIFVAVAMVTSLAACSNENGGNDNDGGGTTTTSAAGTESNNEGGGDGTESEEEEVPPVEAEDISYTPLIHLDFESTDGLKAVKQIANDGSVPEGITYALAESSHDILIAEGQGAVGNALYLDGKYGVDFDMVRIDDDSYTISFWYNADRVATFGPVVQMGRNIAGQSAGDPVTWVNITKSTWGDNSADIFPVAWNRNSGIGTEVSADGVFPWIYAMDNMEHGKREWCLFTIVVDGNRYVADDGMERIATKLYLDGELKWEANAENMYYQGISPEIFAGDGLEGHIGINYWDTIYKGFIDELYVYDEPLTDGQVKTLFEQGNPPASPVAPEYEYVDEEGDVGGDAAEPEPIVDEPGNLTVTSFFGNKTEFTALKNGETLTYSFTNTSNGSNNWDNFVMAVANADADSYAGADNEVIVIRADAWGWGGGASDFVAPDGEGNALTFETDANFDEWQTKMKEGADVNLTIALDGNTLNYKATIGEYNVSLSATSGVDLPDTLYVFFTGENCKLTNIAVS